MATKACTTCGEKKPATGEYFSKSKKSKDGYRWDCKDCQKKYREKNKDYLTNHSRKWREKNKEHVKQYKKDNEDRIKKYRKENASRAAETGKRWQENNKERLLATRRKWNQENKQRKAELNRRWCEQNPEKRLNSGQRRRTMRRDLPATMTTEQWEFAVKQFDNKCAYCRQKVKLTQDHVIPVSQGGYHTRQNIVPACSFCNASKGARDMQEWYSKQLFFNNEQLKRIYKWTGFNGGQQQLALF